MTEYIPYIAVPEDWFKRKASSYADFARLAGSTEEFLKELPREKVKKLANQYKEYETRDAFGAFSKQTTKDKEWQTGFDSAHKKEEEPLESNDE